MSTRFYKTLEFLLFSSIFLFCQSALSQNNSYKVFIPKGYSVLDTATGDLNKDAYKDMVLILKADYEKDSLDVNRPLLLLAGTSKNEYQLIARNDSVVLCYSCGGIFGDPYQAITIKNGYFSIEHYGGSNWRWTRIITFKYDPKIKQFRLHKDAGVSYHTFNLDKQEKLEYYPERFGKVLFSSYTSE